MNGSDLYVRDFFAIFVFAVLRITQSNSRLDVKRLRLKTGYRVLRECYSYWDIDDN